MFSFFITSLRWCLSSFFVCVYVLCEFLICYSCIFICSSCELICEHGRRLLVLLKLVLSWLCDFFYTHAHTHTQNGQNTSHKQFAVWIVVAYRCKDEPTKIDINQTRCVYSVNIFTFWPFGFWSRCNVFVGAISKFVRCMYAISHTVQQHIRQTYSNTTFCCYSFSAREIVLTLQTTQVNAVHKFWHLLFHSVANGTKTHSVIQ